jgi:hypothetical protein
LTKGFKRPPVVQHSVSGMYVIRDGDWKFIDGLGDGFTIDWPKTTASWIDKPVKDTITGKFKDIVYYFPPFHVLEIGEPKGQLFNLKIDPLEKENLIEDHTEVVKRLENILKYEQQRTIKKNIESPATR